MSGVNKVIILGRVGNNPEIKTLSNGNMMTTVSIATSEKFTLKSGEKQEKTEWHSCVFFGKVAEIANKYLTKGDLTYIEGKLQTRSWDKDGIKHYKTEIVASTLQLLSPKKQQDNQANGFEVDATLPQSEEEGSLPF